MKPLNLILGAVMILIGLFILYMAAGMFQHAFRDLFGYLQGTLIIAIGAALAYLGYKQATKQ